MKFRGVEEVLEVVSDLVRSFTSKSPAQGGPAQPRGSQLRKEGDGSRVLSRLSLSTEVSVKAWFAAKDGSRSFKFRQCNRYVVYGLVLTDLGT
ncbi:hypothetical protein TorRG33x02_050280 [Trema orientale]|uniref:Uncharacterized protein n=1 Tax=Trema orientale TaxID=63057 RepID=A0A2P5FMZ1_TREOI|nr:hypothetical protein TorRG33x02_050280 [Trema orientale]